MIGSAHQHPRRREHGQCLGDHRDQRGHPNGTLAFAGFQNLTGGSANDTFAFLPGGSIAGNLKGGRRPTPSTTPSTAARSRSTWHAKTATGIGGTWTNIQIFIGTGTTDTLVGANANNTWSITGTNAGTVGAYSFAASPT